MIKTSISRLLSFFYIFVISYFKHEIDFIVYFTINLTTISQIFQVIHLALQNSTYMYCTETWIVYAVMSNYVSVSLHWQYGFYPNQTCSNTAHINDLNPKNVYEIWYIALHLINIKLKMRTCLPLTREGQKGTRFMSDFFLM